MRPRRIFLDAGSGESFDDPTPEERAKLLDALDPNDVEHGAAWLSDEDENVLEYEVGGNLCFGRRDRESRHQSGVSKARVLDLWALLVRGDLDSLEKEAWRPGTRPPLSPEEIEERRRWERDQDRTTWEQLGPERAGTRCRKEGCGRGTVAFSVLCRAHHFESLRGRPYTAE